MMWTNVKLVEQQGGTSPAEMTGALNELYERATGVLAKLSGNLASTVRDASGQMNQVGLMRLVHTAERPQLIWQAHASATVVQLGGVIR